MMKICGLALLDTLDVGFLVWPVLDGGRFAWGSMLF